MPSGVKGRAGRSARAEAAAEFSQSDAFSPFTARAERRALPSVVQATRRPTPPSTGCLSANAPCPSRRVHTISACRCSPVHWLPRPRWKRIRKAFWPASENRSADTSFRSNRANGPGFRCRVRISRNETHKSAWRETRRAIPKPQASRPASIRGRSAAPCHYSILVNTIPFD